jgi:hypothetical protein
MRARWQLDESLQQGLYIFFIKGGWGKSTWLKRATELLRSCDHSTDGIERVLY